MKSGISGPGRESVLFIIAEKTITDDYTFTD